MYKNNKPLVSIVVITYNSSKYVIDLLESIYRQSYKNIELIISDDASKDNTVDICNKWIKDNKSRFINVEIITTVINTGIAPNCNRGVKSAKGEWIKLIAGDDILFDSCIQDNITFAVNNINKPEFIFSKAVTFKGDIKNTGSTLGVRDCQSEFFKYNPRDQFKTLLGIGDIEMDADLAAPTSFIKRDKLKKLGYFNEMFPFIEDRPLWLEATKNNNRLYCLNKETVFYRVEESIQRNTEKFVNENYHNSRKLFLLLDKVNYYDLSIPKHRKVYNMQRHSILIGDIIIYYFKNRNNILTKIFLIMDKFITKLFRLI